ncbi:uncharacterized protein G2W53_010740 [Senna tora]|uniref:Uncharacterized protein n=1 Tax=Senna tora TaxID=362788 RepID=A0A834X0G2_9FABA|nr:uncharacterized protein G2W53_010740 [Senna tora]
MEGRISHWVKCSQSPTCSPICPNGRSMKKASFAVAGPLKGKNTHMEMSVNVPPNMGLTSRHHLRFHLEEGWSHFDLLELVLMSLFGCRVKHHWHGGGEVRFGVFQTGYRNRRDIEPFGVNIVVLVRSPNPRVHLAFFGEIRPDTPDFVEGWLVWRGGDKMAYGFVAIRGCSKKVAPALFGPPSKVVQILLNVEI